MKKILFIAAIAAMACACGNKAATEEAAAEEVAVEACCEEAHECCGKCAEAAEVAEEADKTLGEKVEAAAEAVSGKDLEIAGAVDNGAEVVKALKK